MTSYSYIAILGFTLALTACTTQALWSVDHHPVDVTTVKVERVYGHSESTLTIIPPDAEQDKDGGK